MNATDRPAAAAGAARLLKPETVRERAREMLALGEAGRLSHFTVHRDALPSCAEYVLETIRDAYPTFRVPFHARWRHFTAGGLDRWRTLERAVQWASGAERARAAFDLAIVSVLLDAGAGPGWRYREARSGETYARSEGLAVASFDMFARGAFADHRERPLRADGARLASLSVADLEAGFQVDAGNPLLGLEGRVRLLNALGRATLADGVVFGRADGPRPGGLFDVLAHHSVAGRLPASAILAALLTHLAPIWPQRLNLGGVDLGDTWRHPLIAPAESDGTAGLVPFHKLSQWLAYSLIEPLEEAGIEVIGIDALTGLPEYRNGGLFLDSGVLRLRDEADAGRSHEVGSALVVEWRALTVALLDEVAVQIRRKLDVDAGSWPLAKVLEGGTWAAGRRIAREKRAGGGPPLAVDSDGTVF